MGCSVRDHLRAQALAVRCRMTLAGSTTGGFHLVFGVVDLSLPATAGDI